MLERVACTTLEKSTTNHLQPSTGHIPTKGTVHQHLITLQNWRYLGEDYSPKRYVLGGNIGNLITCKLPSLTNLAVKERLESGVYGTVPLQQLLVLHVRLWVRHLMPSFSSVWGACGWGAPKPLEKLAIR